MRTYYHQVLKFNLMEFGLFSVLPWLTVAFSANVGGWIAYVLVSRGLFVTTVRKIKQTIGFLGPAFFLTQLSHADSPAMAVFCMACSQGTDAFSQSILDSNHQDIAPRYSLSYCLGYPTRLECWQGSLEQQQLVTSYNMVLGMMFSKFQLGIYSAGTVVWNEKMLD
ncbi:hypothetical protein SLA2020_253460 [Shorea laevis]